MNIPFAPPYVNNSVKTEVMDTLNSGWITTGPKVKALEEHISIFTKAPNVLCVNSWTSGAILMLKWFNLQATDEVIVPAYTYAATALAVIHAGGTPVMVDVGSDFNISLKEIEKAITPRTKVIMPVDFAGWPCDYIAINKLVEDKKYIFQANGEVQKKLGRILVVSDAAHSIGAKYFEKQTGVLTDVTIFSLHAVKNITTAEGGAICLNLKAPFDNSELYGLLRCYSLNGQTKDAFTKSKKGAWKYDIIFPGLKINMPDVLAAIGLGQLGSYNSHILPKRIQVFETYNSFFKNKQWAIVPPHSSNNSTSSCHLYALRIKGANEEQRDQIISLIAEDNVAVNVHFQPLPLLTLFKEMGFNMKDYPVAYQQFQNEISLPIYPQLTEDEVNYIMETVSNAVEEILC